MHVGGWAGVVLVVVVWYIAAADMIAHQYGRAVLPPGDLSKASRATTAHSR